MVNNHRVLTPSGRGAFNDRMIIDMIKTGHIIGATAGNVNPASLDLTLSAEAYRVCGLIRPQKTEKVRDLLQLIGAKPHDLSLPFERGVTYLVRLNEHLQLYADAYGWANPKSSTGRNGLHVRLLADYCAMYDEVPRGYDGELWLTLTPRYYPIIAHDGDPLTQLRIFNANTRLSRIDLESCFDRFGLLWHKPSSSGKRQPVAYREWLDAGRVEADGAVLLTPSVPPKHSFVGYCCQGTNDPLDLRSRDVNPELFYQRVYSNKADYVHLKAGMFYILSTNEAVKVPPELACELRDIDTRFGEMKLHIAGFIDSGFGYGAQGYGQGSQVTLEVTLHEDTWLRAGDVVGGIKFERMVDVPSKHYDELTKSNYRRQWGPRLAKQFKKLTA